MRRTVVLAGVLFVMCGAPALAQSGPAPGAPGAEALWTQADKDGFGTATSTQSKVWHTLDDGELTEVYYPDLGTPAVRDLQLVVSDGRSFAVRETDATTHRTELLDRRSLTYRQVNTDREGRFRITKTYVTDPSRNALLVDVRFESLTRRPLQLYVLHDPALSNDGSDDSGSVAGSALLVQDPHAGGALAASPRFTHVSNGYLGASDGWQDLRADLRMDWSYASAPDGNVVQTARTSLTGLRHHRTMTLALGFGADAPAALGPRAARCARGFWRAAARYAHGWHGYLRSLRPAPRNARAFRTTYDVSAMTLAAHEDKTYRGAYVASPSMPWVWGQGLEKPSAAYHLVWARDLYQIATGLLAAGDRAGAARALDYLFFRQQEADGSFPQNSLVDGTPKWMNEQLDETALPIVLAWQLGRARRRHLAASRRRPTSWPRPVRRRRRSAGRTRRATRRRRSPPRSPVSSAPPTCGAQRRPRERGRLAGDRRRVAGERPGWTATTNGPFSTRSRTTCA